MPGTASIAWGNQEGPPVDTLAYQANRVRHVAQELRSYEAFDKDIYSALSDQHHQPAENVRRLIHAEIPAADSVRVALQWLDEAIGAALLNYSAQKDRRSGLRRALSHDRRDRATRGTDIEASRQAAGWLAQAGEDLKAYARVAEENGLRGRADSVRTMLAPECQAVADELPGPPRRPEPEPAPTSTLVELSRRGMPDQD